MKDSSAIALKKKGRGKADSANVSFDLWTREDDRRARFCFVIRRLRARRAWDYKASFSSDWAPHPPSPSPQKTGERGGKRSGSGEHEEGFVCRF